MSKRIGNPRLFGQQKLDSIGFTLKNTGEYEVGWSDSGRIATQGHEYDQNTLYEVLKELIKYNLKNNRRTFSQFQNM